ncbi:amino acid transporter [Micromonospora soli]|uniref:amino acid transporter n=1 Tax=Micromonospora sp. NBRC 110009 TaxID=3061627 RepID=UPI002673E031|nr:amino acid transporter [Micromonospora sp. NBRC 110009]WKU00466.1 amino acid transporter [Micromonospora sp. NBRC 110009]
MSVGMQDRVRERRKRPLRDWLLADTAARPVEAEGPYARPEQHHHSWWKVMCLTGVDYFSTLGYQPGIAALAAGVLSPIATLVLVLVTLLGALPVYRRVAQDSPHGEGSIAMLVKLLTYWQGKLFVLVLLGFAATDFIITITLSAADATAHIDENPFWPAGLRGHEVIITLLLVALLGAVFLKGFTEAIGIAVGLVGVYLTLNAVVVVDALWRVVTHPARVTDWTAALTTQHGDPLLMVGIALLVFPKLALGLSGFETGVAVMPHIEGDSADTEKKPAGRIRGARRLLTTAAVIMSIFLVTSSIVTTVLIPAEAFKPGGAANGRALAYLAHQHLGEVFGTVYDLSTIAILWFAGASAMAGLLNLVPRYLPRYGMAPTWARAVRPLVLVFTLVAFVITIAFEASVDAQGGAYATGVLVLITSAATAVTLSARHRRQHGRTVAFGIIAVIFVYTTIANVVERPDGVKIAACFIAGIIAVSLLSRLFRAFELRVNRVELDPVARQFITEGARRQIRLIAHESASRDAAEYRDKLAQIVADNDFPADADVIFVEVTVTDPSDFETELHVGGAVVHGKYRVLRLASSSVPNALAALLLHVRDLTHRRPHIYFEWTEGNPAGNFLRYLIFGQGEIAPVTREILRQQEPDRSRRPHVHAG